jgi:hypothetical protein
MAAFTNAHSARRLLAWGLLGACSFATPSALAVDLVSSGADGPLAPKVSTEIPLPVDGVLNYTTIDIPADVIVTFTHNDSNTPVVMLATGDIQIGGTIDVSGSSSADAGAAGDGALGDDGLPGRGGPGGFDGGEGGTADTELYEGAYGLGPGAGSHGWHYYAASMRRTYRLGGAGGGFGEDGAGTVRDANAGGSSYGSSLLLPLIGGSGGGGGAGGDQIRGSGGGGGGGAILISTPGTVDVTGAILANGGESGASAGSLVGGTGGGGSGGAIRVVAGRITGDGTISVAGGAAGQQSGTGAGYYPGGGGAGGHGRVRLEADFYLRSAAVEPAEALSTGQPGDLFLVGLPSLRIASVAGQLAPSKPTGVADILLPADAAGPVVVEIEATGIPVGPAVTVTVRPPSGASYSALTGALEGDTNLSTATAELMLPEGSSTLLASVTYVLLADAAENYQRVAGEAVRAMRVEAGLGGATRYVLITERGREVSVRADQLVAARS